MNLQKKGQCKVVHTKHSVVHTLKHLNQATSYVEDKKKTVLAKTKLKSHYEHLFPYIMKDEKTLAGQLVSGHLLTDVYDAANEFLLTRKIFLKRKGSLVEFDPNTKKTKLNFSEFEKGNKRGKPVLAHHIIQSFSPEDHLTPEEIHEIGRKTMLEFTGGEYEFVIATHVDKAHIHNHIILNSTNTLTGNAFRWNKGTKKTFEQVSDKIAGKAGAKIIEKSPKNSHKKYTMWQTENLYKNKIKQRLDFLLDHSSDIQDFRQKAEALNLELNFSGKWATFRLLDEPQIKMTRGRNLVKKDPERYNLDRITEYLKQNDVPLTVTEVKERYNEKMTVAKNEFDYQVVIEPWQIYDVTSKGIYLNVDYGMTKHGQIFIGGYKVDRLENGYYQLYVREKETFYFMDEENGQKNKFITGKNLVKQLQLYNGHVPLKKEKIIETIDDLVDAINFFAQHDVTASQVNNLEQKLERALIEAKTKLKKLDKRIGQLNQAAKLWLKENNQSSLQDAELPCTLSYSEIEEELTRACKSRKLLNKKLEGTIKDLEEYQTLKNGFSEDITKNRSEQKKGFEQ